MKRVAAATLLALAACGSDATDVPPIRASSSSSSSSGSPGTTKLETPDASSPVTAVDAATGGAATTYIGTLSATPATQFGGAKNHCTYDVTLKSVSIEIDVTPAGDVIGGKATDLMVESVVGTCPFLTQPDSQQSFSFATANATALSWLGAAGNHPATKLTVTVTKSGASYEAAATWERTDETDDLKWIVKTQITLGPR